MPRRSNPKGLQNLRPPKKGERGALNRGGRQKGTPNKLTVERVEKEIARLALSDPLLLFTNAHGARRTFTLREINHMAPDIRACIASVKVKTENLTTGDRKQDLTVEVRLWNKVQALELCAKHFKWIADKEATTELDVISKMLDAWKEAHRADGDQSAR